MICDNCVTHTVGTSQPHRCRADESSCVDGKDCPDFIERCECMRCADGYRELPRYNQMFGAHKDAQETEEDSTMPCRICGESIYGIGNCTYGACNECTKLALNHLEQRRDAYAKESE